MMHAFHKVNYIMINPSANRFMFIHSWILNGVKYDRLLTADINGENLYVLLDDNIVSHCNWKNDNTIIAWANTHEDGLHYYLLTDKSQEKHIFGDKVLNTDGHPSYSPNGKYMITDTYPSFNRKQSLFLCNLETEKISKIAKVYANIGYKNENRCDLHPRWKRDSTEICFDGALGKYRQVYSLKIK
jgi:Tol biopolymer transport system component